jgi:hypothetical protein
MYGGSPVGSSSAYHQRLRPVLSFPEIAPLIIFITTIVIHGIRSNAEKSSLQLRNHAERRARATLAFVNKEEEEEEER